MDVGVIGRIERDAERIAALLFAAAAAFGVHVGLAPMVGPPALAGFTAAAAALAFLLCSLVLHAWARHQSFALLPFELQEFGPFQAAEELLLTDADRLVPHGAAAPEPLLLDDILAELGPDSRVVRLFDRKAMPTPGELSARIDDHLGQPPAAAPDASEALSNALAELRRSLR
jgi:hypothetical protein